MNNIEKFKTVKAIAELKTELCRESLRESAKSAVGLNGAFGLDEALTLGKVVASLFKNNQKEV